MPSGIARSREASVSSNSRVPSSKNANRAVGGDESLFCDQAAECGLEVAQKPNLQAAKPRSTRRGADAPGRLEGIADCANAGRPGSPEHRTQHPGEHVGVLVGVDVGQAHAAALEVRDLCGSFALDFSFKVGFPQRLK